MAGLDHASQRGSWVRAVPFAAVLLGMGCRDAPSSQGTSPEMSAGTNVQRSAQAVARDPMVAVPDSVPATNSPSAGLVDDGGSQPTSANRAVDELTTTWPPVVLSAQHAAFCPVGVGDTFPEITCVGLDGTTSTLTDQLGKQLTVVLFWDSRQAMSRTAVRELQELFLSPYGADGVAFVTMEVGSPAAEIRQRLGDVATGIGVWRDPDRTAYQAVAKGLMPRIFLLRADRTIAWLDVEYSRSTRRELQEAIHHELQLPLSDRFSRR